MTTDKQRQEQIVKSLTYLQAGISELLECVTWEIENDINVSECDLQIDLQSRFDNFLHKIGYDYDQRRW